MVLIGSGNLVLHTAPESIQDEVRRVLLEKRLEPNAQNNDVWTPLHVVVKRLSASKVRLLLKYGADRNISEDKHRTSIHLAVNCGNDWIVRILLENRDFYVGRWRWGALTGGGDGKGVE